MTYLRAESEDGLIIGDAWVPDDEEALEEAYVERLHPRDRLGKWAKKIARTIELPASGRGRTAGGMEVPLSQTFKKPERAEAWFKERYPDKEFDFKGADMKLLGPPLIHLSMLMEKYPVAAKRMAGIVMARPVEGKNELSGTGKLDFELDRNAHAGVRRADDMLLLNAVQWGPDSELLNDLEKAELAEWHPPGAATPTAMLTHEFGHVLDHALTAQGEMKWRVPVGNNFGSVGDTWRAWIKDSDKTPVSGYAQQASRGLWDTVDNTEKVAEAFSSIYNTPPELQDEFTQRMAMVLHDIADESKWSPLNNDDTIYFKGERIGAPAITDEEREAFHRERELWIAEHYGPLWTVNRLDKSLYKQLYADNTQHKETMAMYDRRRAVLTEIRDQAEAKKKVEREKESVKDEEERKVELEKWTPRRDELRAQGLSGPEALERLKDEGFHEALMRKGFSTFGRDYGPGTEWAAKFAEAHKGRKKAAAEHAEKVRRAQQ